MLISQRIAQDPTFLKPCDPPTRKEANMLLDIRVKIMQSVKVIVGTEFINMDQYSHVHDETFSDGHPIYPTKARDGKVLKDLNRRYELYGKYCRLPFNLVSFESGKGLYLVEQVKPMVFNQYVVNHLGELEPFGITTDVSKMGAGKDFTKASEVFQVYWKDRIMRQLVLLGEEARDVMLGNMTTHSNKLMDTLLHFNVANSRIHKYCLSTNESRGIPKGVLPQFVYRVLDVFRDRTTYHSLREVEEFAEHDDIERKAHLVKGHFKEWKSGLYWWNPFVRNKNNAGSAGVVVKDYVMH